jgi:RNA polymerase sigma factor (sigma-70 family)
MRNQERDDEDAALVARARAGDRDAFGVLVTRHQRAALRTAFAIGGSESEAEDVTQEAFVKAFRSLRRFEDGRPLRPWLMQIVANEARNRRRSRSRRERLAVRAASVGGRPSGSAEDLALGEVTAGEVRAALARLDDRDRTVIALRYFAGLSEAETAGALEVPPGTVKSRLSRALDRLSAELEGAVR